MTNSWTPPDTQREWEQARRTAFVQDILSAFTEQEVDLLPFEKVRQKLQLRDARYLGLQDAPLDHIVGSVGRYQDFTRAFFPRRGVVRDRWRKIARLTATIDGRLPPVELYKVGEVYFVRDGNHRISAARQQKLTSIEAYVWEYETRVPLDVDTTAVDLVRKAAHTAFLQQTDVDQFLCDDMRIELSQPDAYEDLLHESKIFQRSLSRIDDREVPFAEAVGLWCEMSYTPIIEITRERDILREFPGRTEADLYLWLSRNQEELETRYEHQVLIDEAADDLAERFGQRPSAARRVAQTVGRMAGGVGELGSRLARNIALSSITHEDDSVASALLAPVRRVAENRLPCRFQGTTRGEWDIWCGDLGERLWELLGVGNHPWQPFDSEGLNAEVEEQVEVDGLWRELIWLSVDQDLRLPVYLFRPQEGNGPRPAVVISPGHGTIDQTIGLEDSCQQANALELARAGFITLAVEPRGFGLLDAVNHVQIDAAARLVGRTWYGLLIHDTMRTIDYLQTRPDVDSNRIGMAGIGAGSAVAMYTAVLDQRIQAAFVSSYLNKYVSASLEDEHCPCDTIPGILRYADMGDVAALIAPRPVMFVHGRNDPTGNLGARQSFAIVRHVYHLLGVPRQARMIEPEGMGHVFDNELAVGWLRRWLG